MSTSPRAYRWFHPRLSGAAVAVTLGLAVGNSGGGATLVASVLNAVLPRSQDPYNEKPASARTRDFDVQHIALDIAFDVPHRMLIGTATLRIAPLADRLREVSLDSANLAIDVVTIEGRPLEVRTAEDKLHVVLDREYPKGLPLNLVVKYHAQPKRGLFFVMPDRNHPHRPAQLWAQGDTAGGNNRYWFPNSDPCPVT